MVCDKAGFYQETGEFVEKLVSDHGCSAERELFDQLMDYQKEMIIYPYVPETISMDLDYNFHGYFKAILMGEEAILERNPSSLIITPERCFQGDLKHYAQEVVWYGQKGRKFRHSNVADAGAAKK